MPASMMIACVAFRPKVTGNRMEMPARGPIPGRTPTRVPTRQPRNAYHALAGASATEKPGARQSIVLSKVILKSEWAGLERRLEDVDEQDVSDRNHANTVNGGRQQRPPFDDDK